MKIPDFRPEVSAKDAVNATAAKRDMIPQQSAIAGHGNLLWHFQPINSSRPAHFGPGRYLVLFTWRYEGPSLRAGWMRQSVYGWRFFLSLTS